MNNVNSQEPKLNADKFICLHCGVFAQQSWTNGLQFVDFFIKEMNNYLLEYRHGVEQFYESVIRQFCQSFSAKLGRQNYVFLPEELNFSFCHSCTEWTIWIGEDIVFPKQIVVPEPNEDLEEDVKKLYREAGNIFHDSPRAAAALLRVCIEKLCRSLDSKKGNLHSCINRLRDNKGLSSEIVDSLHICRVIGNEAVHPGKIDFEEDFDKVNFLFILVNDIAEELVSKPKKIQESYGSILNPN